MNIIKEDIREHMNEHDIILVGTNTYQNMSNGFQRFIRLNYPYVFEKNLETKYGDENKMGTILECQESSEPLFLLCFINDGKIIYRPDLNDKTKLYEALEKCLKTIHILYHGKNIASTIIGASRFDGNGDKEQIIRLFEEYLPDITSYDYDQTSRSEELIQRFKEEQQVKKKDRKAYYEMVRQRKEEAEKRFQKNKRTSYSNI